MKVRQVLFCAPLLAMCTLPAWGQGEEEPRKVLIRGQEFEMYPLEKLRARGIEPPDIPHDQNAAWVYVDAMNAMVDLPEDLWDSLETAMKGQWPEGEAGDRLAAWLEQNKPSLDLARRAAVMDAYYLPFFRGETDALLAALLPTLGHTRQLARTLSVEATYLGLQVRHLDDQTHRPGMGDPANRCGLERLRARHNVG